jgi:LacI family transcriptional regulator
MSTKKTTAVIQADIAAELPERKSSVPTVVTGSQPFRTPMTMRDFAARIGVSKTTVSKAFTHKGRIAPQTRATVLKAADELGFSLNPHAQRLSNGRSTDQAYLFCAGTGGSQGEKLWRIQQALTMAGLDAPVYTSTRLDWESVDGQISALEKLRRQRPRAIICSTVILPPVALEELRAYQEEGGIVIAYDVPVDLDCDSVVFDRFDNAYCGTQHLLENGHREIGIYFAGSLADKSGFLMPRLEGFRAALADWGVSERPEWIFDGTGSEASGANLFQKYLELSPRPTALVIVNEAAAAAFIHAAIRHGIRVPDEISVVSNDGLPVGTYAAVPITTTTSPSLEIANAVVHLALERLAHPERPAECIVVQGELIVRESVATRKGLPTS